MVQGLEPVYDHSGVSLEQVGEIIRQLKTQEATLKVLLGKWMTAGAFDNSPVLKEQIQQFQHKDYAYFTGKEFLNDELNELHRIINESWSAINKFNFRKFKGLLQAQLPYLN
ncbi:hypothetical protein A3860_18310 [Niastella vici]|uniref:Uncharacterized protein n=1 Tax=Niastella vici TaxID=1703345 RepID=A0A1V9G2M4_9BACT|nr:hypothetical protein [Niastella vici]OQP64716.1 hypothetical protein A3860_18310 [Niastella vici]